MNQRSVCNVNKKYSRCLFQPSHLFLMSKAQSLRYPINMVFLVIVATELSGLSRIRLNTLSQKLQVQ